MISAEAPPLQRTGALVDVMEALPHELRARGHEVGVALPYYREIRENRAFKKKDTGVTVDVQLGDKTYVAKYLEGRSAGGVQLFLVRCDEFSIGRESTVSEAKPTKITRRGSFFWQSGVGTRPAIDAATANSAHA